MTAGRSVGDGTPTSYDAPPTDTGEALGLDAAGLTLTFGFGPTLFEKDGKDRFGIRTRSPRSLRELPHFPADNLDPGRSNGDLCIQACAHDPQVAVHAIRNLARMGFGTVAMRWAQLGFGRTSSTSTAAGHPAQPARLQGRHRRTSRPRTPTTSRSSSGSSEGDDDAADWLDRRLLPGGPPDQHAHRAVGPDQPARAGDAHRPGPRRGRTALRRHRVHRARLRPARAATVR